MGGDNAPAQDLGVVLKALRYALQPATPIQSELQACHDVFADQGSNAALSLAAELIATSSCSHEELGASLARCVTRIALDGVQAPSSGQNAVTPVQEGVLRDNRILPNGVLRSTVVFSILASEWPAVKAGLDARLAVFK